MLEWCTALEENIDYSAGFEYKIGAAVGTPPALFRV